MLYSDFWYLMTNIVRLHEKANCRLDALSSAVRVSVKKRAADEHRRPARVDQLPACEYDTVAACDEALAVVRSRITDLERLPAEDVTVGDARDRALAACHLLTTEINAQRSRLAFVE